MSFLKRIADGIRSHQQELQQDRHPYLASKSSGFGKKWVLKQYGEGCRALKAQTAISMEKDPPPLPGEIAKTATSAKPVAEKSTKADPAAARQKTIGMQKRTADPKTTEEDCAPPPPFDMLDLPNAMEAMGFPYAAKNARRWFGGKPYAPPDKSAIYKNEFVDEDTFKLDWILSFGTVRERYNHLLTYNKDDTVENIYNTRAREQLSISLENFLREKDNYHNGNFDSLRHCNHDKQKLHSLFQFQRVNISVFDSLGEITPSMNDLEAALGNFAIFAAIAAAEFSTKQYNRYDTPWRECTHPVAKITHIYLYARDTYSFNDAPNQPSQYLGHWNKTGVIIAIDSGTADAITNFSKKLPNIIANTSGHERGNERKRFTRPLPPNLEKTVETRNIFGKSDYFYPVRNRDFQNWRALKNRGGDFVIYSDFQKIRLSRPITIDLGERCKRTKT